MESTRIQVVEPSLDVSKAREAVQKNIDDQTADSFARALEALAELPVDLFAEHPGLRHAVIETIVANKDKPSLCRRCEVAIVTVLDHLLEVPVCSSFEPHLEDQWASVSELYSDMLERLT